MKRLIERGGWMWLICLLASAALLAACGDDGGDGGGRDVGADAGRDVGQDAQADAAEDASIDAAAFTCVINGLDAPTGLELDETAFDWSLFGQNDGQLVSLSLSKDGGLTDTGTADFVDVPLSQADNSLLVGNECTAQGCQSYYQAVAGTIEISAFQKTEGGSFAMTLTDLVLVEIEFDQTSGEAVRVDDTRGWCVDSVYLTGTTDPSDPFAATCDTNGFNAPEGTQTAKLQDGPDTPLVVEAATSTSAPTDVLSLQIYPGFEGAADAPGTYAIDDYDFATCANCLLLYAGCDAQDNCDRIYSAGEGQLEVSSIGGVGDQFTATLTDAKLVEVTIDPNTYDTEIVDDATGWCISSYQWNVGISAPSD